MSEEMNQLGVLVVGAGIAGMAAAMHLTEVEEQVLLLDSSPTIGGSMHLLDHTFPSDSCGLCLMLPDQPSFCPTLECERRHGLTILPYCDLLRLDGHDGDFHALVQHKPRFVNDYCDGCGLCAHVCPEARPHDLEGWLAPVKAIFRPAGLRAAPATWLVDMRYCTRCGKCVNACPRAAIDLDMLPSEQLLHVAAVLLSPGYMAFDARKKGEYGYGVYPNVLTSLEFERMASLAGTSLGRLQRPSGRGPLRRIAFIHCVGSRDERAGAGYCSSACCMYTAKQVKLAKKADPNLDVTVFFMDLRAAGKGYEEYITGVQKMPGVRYLRAMPSSIHHRERSKELLIGYVADDGKQREECFDLVVLAVGLSAPVGLQTVARHAGVDLDGYGFACTQGYHPLRSAREGIFVAGSFREPKEIPETVAEAAAAAAEVAAYLRKNRDQKPASSTPPAPPLPAALRSVADEEPRVGVFLCETNPNLPADDLLEFARRLPGVALALQAAGQETIAATIDAERLNRVVVAGGNGHLAGDSFDAMMRSLGLDGRLLRRVSLREQVLYPHAQTTIEIGPKAQSLVAMAVASLTSMKGLEALSLGGSQQRLQRALVAGGGAAGMSAALALAAMGIDVDLLERNDQLGGQWRELRFQADGSDAQAALQAICHDVAAQPRIHLHLASQVRSLTGKPGAYRTTIAKHGQETKLEHGAVVLATGGRPVHTTDYLYGLHPAVLTQRELEQRPSTAGLDTVVMIQCVDSREEQRPYCSRICCTQAIKNALRLKAQNPSAHLFILYRDVRTFGFREEYYRLARQAGVVFVRFDLPDKPQVSTHDGKLLVQLRDPLTRLPLRITADAVVLSVGIEAEEDHTLPDQLGLKLDPWAFLEEEHRKMKPLDLAPGVYVAGLAHSPRFLDEAIVQGQAAAMRAAAWLWHAHTPERASSVWVEDRLCSFCGLCVEACPYQARVMDYDKRVASVDYGLCQGCGVCAVVCPNKATKQKGYEQRQLMAEVDMALV
jgi:heterodisulfide reductase subunit A